MCSKSRCIYSPLLRKTAAHSNISTVGGEESKLKMRRTRLIAVGACSIDTILTVPHFPEEDSKLRATSFTRRRGGNCPNTLEVLIQLLQLDDRSDVELNLVATLPARTSRGIEFIRKSFEYSSASCPKRSDEEQSLIPSSQMVDLEHCLYREKFSEPVSSYIISSSATTSRTIINHNPLPEMTYDEFVKTTETLLGYSNSTSAGPDAAADERLWFHFEGRIPETTLQCIRYIRSCLSSKGRSVDLKISVELEKPGREGLQELALEGDVVFYSRSWAEGEGYSSADICLRSQAKMICDHASNAAGGNAGASLLICTWGSSGACAISLTSLWSDISSVKQGKREAALDVESSSAYTSPNKPIVDTTGAGDTFVAGVLFGLICKGEVAELSEQWSINQTLDFANKLAGRKILQHGFRLDEISLKPR